MPRLTKNKIFYLAIFMAAILQLISAQKDPPAEAVNEGDAPKKPKSGEAGSNEDDPQKEDPQKEDSQQQDGKVKSKDSKTSKISIQQLQQKMASNPTSIGQSEIMGTDAFSDKHIYDAKAGKVATMKHLDDAYNQRLEELDGLEPAEKQRMEKMLNAAHEQLTKLVETGEAIQKTNKLYNDPKYKDKAQKMKHLALLGLSDSVPDRILLTSPRYDEATQNKRFQDLALPLKTVLDNYPTLKQEAEGALKHIDSAYNDLKRYSFVNTIQSVTNGGGGGGGVDADAKVLGVGDAAQLRQMPRPELLRKYSDRRDGISKLKSDLMAATAPADQGTVEILDSAMKKLEDAFVENLDAVGNNPRAIPSANAGNQQQQRANAQANPQLAPANPNVNPNMNPRPPPMQTQGDLATNCGLHVHQCFEEPFRQGMAQKCAGTCAAVGADGRDLGTNCPEMAVNGFCVRADYRFSMSKFCAGSCRGQFRKKK